MEAAAIVGDRMDTDIIAGIHSDIDTVPVLSGVTCEEDLKQRTKFCGYAHPILWAPFSLIGE